MAKIPANRLEGEKSPYLLQHVHDPIAWFPWSEEVFVKARNENKPVFISIGYSSCHWCHVMHRESFSDPETAGILNESFIAVKVDREERPDIDNFYMKAVMALSGVGGWPLTVFTDADKKPFMGATYLPREDGHGRTGLKRILRMVADRWRTERNKLTESGAEVTNFLANIQQPEKGKVLTRDLLDKGFESVKYGFDPVQGGQKGVPKFPIPHISMFLLRYWKSTGKEDALEIALKTLREMARGGIQDHLGGGFHRYSTDEQWRLPHFEKMGYDQALICRAYLEAYQATKEEIYADVARRTLDYVQRRLENPKGGFFSSEDADSQVPDSEETEEGIFYLWGKSEIIRILGPEDGEIFCYAYGVEEKGNVPVSGKNVLFLARDYRETSAFLKRKALEIRRIIDKSREKLFKVRQKRPLPQIDEKILTDWNGLMISAFSLASMVLNQPGYADAAEKSARFILENLKDGRNGLLHSYRDGKATISGFIEDYAFFIQGLIDLYEITLDHFYLQSAMRLGNMMLDKFWDGEKGGFFLNPKDEAMFDFQQKKVYDGDYPSGNSVAALALLRLGRMTGDRELEEKATAIFTSFGERLTAAPQNFTYMLMAFDFAVSAHQEIVVSGERKDVQPMLEKIFSGFLPDKVVLFRPANETQAAPVLEMIPSLRDQIPQQGKTTAYVCENYSCKKPVKGEKELEKVLFNLRPKT